MRTDNPPYKFLPPCVRVQYAWDVCLAQRVATAPAEPLTSQETLHHPSLVTTPSATCYENIK